MVVRKRITIISISRPKERSVNEELQWLCDSLGLFGLRDRDRSCFRIFIELLKTSKQHQPISSDEIADRLSSTRGTVVHHLNKLSDCVIIIQQRTRYKLREPNLEILMDDLRRDFEEYFKELKKTAKEIDDVLEL